MNTINKTESGGAVGLIIGIWHKKRGTGIVNLLNRLKNATPGMKDATLIERPDTCDVMISDGPAPDALHPCRCRVAVLPGDSPLDLQHLSALRVITYGMSGHNTVTVSSVTDDRLFLALQREIVGLTGELLERQELVVRNAPGTQTALAAAATLLACGSAPESLEHIFDA